MTTTVQRGPPPRVRTLWRRPARERRLFFVLPGGYGMDERRQYLAIGRARHVLRPLIAELLEQTDGNEGACIEALRVEFERMRAMQAEAEA
jgi:hypothetical protein